MGVALMALGLISLFALIYYLDVKWYPTEEDDDDY